MHYSTAHLGGRGATFRTGLQAAAAAASSPRPTFVQCSQRSCDASGRSHNAVKCTSSVLGTCLHAKQTAAGTRCSLIVRFKAQDQQQPQAAAHGVLSDQPPVPSVPPPAPAAPNGSSDSSADDTTPLPPNTAASSASTAATTGTAPSGVAGSTVAATGCSSSSSSSSAKEQAQLLKQLLQLQSVSSVESMDGSDILPTPQQVQQVINSSPPHQKVPGPQQLQQQRSAPPLSLPLKPPTAERRVGSLYDDASAEDYDPMLLDMMGFTSVAQYLQYKVDLAVRQAKLDLLHAAVWLSLGAGFINAMGGFPAYSHYVHEVTERGAAPDNLTFVWVFLLGYYTVKTGVMGLATSWRAWQARTAEPDMLQQLETEVEKQHQRLAYWMLQERLLRYEYRANRCYTEFALASLLLGVLMLMKGGLDDLQLQLETVNQAALSGLLTMMVLFWESYFSSISAVVQVVQLGSAWVNKIRHKQKWERD